MIHIPNPRVSLCSLQVGITGNMYPQTAGEQAKELPASHCQSLGQPDTVNCISMTEVDPSRSVIFGWPHGTHQPEAASHEKAENIQGTWHFEDLLSPGVRRHKISLMAWARISPK